MMQAYVDGMKQLEWLKAEESMAKIENRQD
jgi:hypothetical protein